MANMYRSNEAELESNNYNEEESEDDADLDLLCSSSSHEAREDEENENNNAGGAVTPTNLSHTQVTMLQVHHQKTVIQKTRTKGFMIRTVHRCQCSHCVVMATGIECVSCQEIPKVTYMIVELEIEQELKCISEHPGFEPVCLNTYVLQTAYYQYRQQYGLEVEDSNEYV